MPTTTASQRRNSNNNNSSNSLFYILLSFLLTLLETITIMPPSAEAFVSSSLLTSLATTGFFPSSTKTATTTTTATAATITTTSSTALLGLRQRRGMGGGSGSIMDTSSSALSFSSPSPRRSASSYSSSRRKLRILPPPSLQRMFGNENKICPDLLSCLNCPPIPDDLLVCSVISGSASSSDAAAGGEQQPAPKGEVFFDSSKRNKQQSWWSRPASAVSTSASSWKEKLLKISNFASALCVIDCTVLPLVTVVLPLFGIVAASPAQMQWLHEFGHQVALYFVMPVGTMATTLNYSTHQKLSIASLGWIGLLAILLANGGCHLFPHFHGPIGHALHELTHLLHHGIMHRVTNLTGCFLLLLSNYLSRRQKGACHDPACARKH